MVEPPRGTVPFRVAANLAMKLRFFLSLAVAAEAVRLAALRPILELSLHVPLPTEKLDFATGFIYVCHES